MSGEGNLKLTEKIEKATVVLIDIAGTSSSICFVKDTLFPYVLKKAESYLSDKWENSEVKEIVQLLRDNDSEIAKDGEKNEIIKSVVASLETLTEKNSDLEAFKNFQGLIYSQGYESGDLKGHIFPDVATQLPIWSNTKKICVYSTGSVESQKLLFAHSTEGNLSEHITEYFDMAVGVKTEPASYKKIVEKLQCKSEDIVFLTDSISEAKAGAEAGINAVLVIREGNDEIPEDEKKNFPVITSFAELTLETSSKRKISEEPEQEAPPAKVAKTDSEKTEKVADEKPAEVTEEKMEVDAEVITEAKTETEEKNNDTEVVSSTSDTPEEKKEKPETATKESVAESKEVEVNEEKSETKEKNKDVPSTEEKTVESEEKTEAVENTEKQTDIPESTETKATDSKETKKEIVDESTTKETVDKKEPEDKVDSSIDAKVESTETIEEKQDTETTEKTEPESTNVTNSEETKETEKSVDESATTEKNKETVESEKPAVEESAETKNGDAKENGSTNDEKNKSEEKENQSELANGAHIENGDEKKATDEESEIKVKKVEAEPAETETVSVEVTA